MFRLPEVTVLVSLPPSRVLSLRPAVVVVVSRLPRKVLLRPKVEAEVVKALFRRPEIAALVSQPASGVLSLRPTMTVAVSRLPRKVFSQAKAALISRLASKLSKTALSEERQSVRLGRAPNMKLKTEGQT